MRKSTPFVRLRIMNPVHRYSVIVLVTVLALSMSAIAEDMFVSVRDSMVSKHVFPTQIEGLRRLGVQAIEINLGHDFSVNAFDRDEKVILSSDADAEAFKKHAEQLGVRIWAVMTVCDFSKGDMESHIAWMARAIEIADLLGASCVRVDSAMSRERELDHEARVALFVEGLSGALARTADSKVTVGIENHGFQGNNLAFLLNVYQQVGSDRLGSTLDTGNFYWRGYPLSEVYGILRILAPYAKHTHFKNIDYPEEKREIMREAGWEYGKYYAPLYEGNIDTAKVVQMLYDAGYRGDLCIEDESIGKCKTPEERIAVLERDVAHMRKVLENIKK